ncbi:acyl-CoA reductase, partial [Streptomyces sp. NPDC058964]|uniref:acyl-CoA reductase n=1 Tax=Streptomyces sp. NPDC058964 TaxID=3346681 RepID=UPI003680B1D6
MSTTSVLHLWQGEFVDDAEAARRLAGLAESTGRVLARPLPTEVVLGACAAAAEDLGDPGSALYRRLAGQLPADEVAATLAELATALSRQALERKLRRELGGLRPERLTRPDARETVYESWAPVGLLVHIAPGNATSVAPLSVVEGLLAGNLNVLKTSAADTALALDLLAAIGAADPTGLIAERVSAQRCPSSRGEWRAPRWDGAHAK